MSQFLNVLYYKENANHKPHIHVKKSFVCKHPHEAKGEQSVAFQIVSMHLLVLREMMMIALLLHYMADSTTAWLEVEKFLPVRAMCILQ